MRVKIEGIKYEIDYVSKDDFAKFGEHGKRSYAATLMSGGFIASVFTEVAKKAAIDHFKENDTLMQELEATPVGPYIVVLKEMADLLSEEETMAVLCHEEAHLNNGDLDVFQDQVPDFENVKILLDEEKELRADAYAIEKVGKEPMVKAIKKIVSYQGELLEKKGIMAKEEFLSKVMTEPIIVKRMAALQS